MNSTGTLIRIINIFLFFTAAFQRTKEEIDGHSCHVHGETKSTA